VSARSSTVRCNVCHHDVHFRGFAAHVAMEKRKYGLDIYVQLRIQREGTKPLKPQRPEAEGLRLYGGIP